MDVLANYSIFQELQLVHDTGYFSALPSLEENWQQIDELLQDWTNEPLLSISLQQACPHPVVDQTSTERSSKNPD
ncbi:hypothetical protein Q7C36_021722 [Tachysurus vachellii]|uniref:Krueppel-like factor 7 n=1 Tax=Tachysurus vachellii TaxID=175792 RepID=A0AA88IQI9_TACVA|nr:hypothetical protein Q7C36_021722 [Tachysurus vachellii]